MKKSQEITVSLKNLLEKKIQAFQELADLTKREIEVILLTKKFPEIEMILEKKQVVLNELDGLAGQWSEIRKVWSPNELGDDGDIFNDILMSLDKKDSVRLNALRDRGLKLAKEIHQLNRTSMALVYTQLEEAEALKTFIMEVFQESKSYDPFVRASKNETLVWELDQKI